MAARQDDVSLIFISQVRVLTRHPKSRRQLERQVSPVLLSCRCSRKIRDMTASAGFSQAQDEARAVLIKLGKQVEPLMKTHGWKVPLPSSTSGFAMRLCSHFWNCNPCQCCTRCAWFSYTTLIPGQVGTLTEAFPSRGVLGYNQNRGQVRAPLYISRSNLVGVPTSQTDEVCARANGSGCANSAGCDKAAPRRQ